MLTLEQVIARLKALEHIVNGGDYVRAQDEACEQETSKTIDNDDSFTPPTDYPKKGGK